TSVHIGDLLVELGYLRAADLHRAVEIQKTTQPQKKLEEILVAGHFIEARRLAEVLAYQLALAYVEPNSADLDQDRLSKGPVKAYADHLFVPVARQDNQVVVAFADPLDQRAREVAESMFGKDLVPAIAMPSAIQEALTLLTRGLQQPKVTSLDESA